MAVDKTRGGTYDPDLQMHISPAAEPDLNHLSFQRFLAVHRPPSYYASVVDSPVQGPRAGVYAPSVAEHPFIDRSHCEPCRAGHAKTLLYPKAEPTFDGPRVSQQPFVTPPAVAPSQARFGGPSYSSAPFDPECGAPSTYEGL